MKLRRFSSPNYPWRLALAVMLANLAAFAILAAGARMHRVLADRPRPDASLASRHGDPHSERRHPAPTGSRPARRRTPVVLHGRPGGGRPRLRPVGRGAFP